MVLTLQQNLRRHRESVAHNVRLSRGEPEKAGTILDDHNIYTIVQTLSHPKLYTDFIIGPVLYKNSGLNFWSTYETPAPSRGCCTDVG